MKKYLQVTCIVLWFVVCVKIVGHWFQTGYIIICDIRWFKNNEWFNHSMDRLVVLLSLYFLGVRKYQTCYPRRNILYFWGVRKYRNYISLVNKRILFAVGDSFGMDGSPLYRAETPGLQGGLMTIKWPKFQPSWQSCKFPLSSQCIFGRTSSG